MASTRKPFLGSWLMRTTALSAAVLISSIPLIVAERLGTPESQAMALARENVDFDAAVDLPVAQPDLDLTLADLHAVSVEEFTNKIKALVDTWVEQGRDGSMIAADIGRQLGTNFASGLHRYAPAEIETLLSNTSIVVSQLMDETPPATQTWRGHVQSGFDEIVSPQQPSIEPTRRVALNLQSYAASLGDPGFDIY